MKGKKKKKDKRVKPVPGTEVVLIECGKPTATGRIYPAEMMANAIAEANRKDNFFVTIPQNDDGRVRLQDVAGKARLSLFEDQVTAHIEVLDTEPGKVLRQMMETGNVSFKPRGVGSVVDGVVQDDYRMLSVAIVEDSKDE